MRKDVKFGLTIGAFLVVTLVVYIIVLSQGGTKATITPEVKVVAGAGGSPDANPTPTPLNPAPNHTDDTAAINNTTDSHDVPAVDLRAGARATPTTVPSVANGQVDWNDVLQRGAVAMNNVPPDHTTTPMPGDASAAHPPVDGVTGHPLIDGPPANSQDPLHMDVAAPDPRVLPGVGPGVGAVTDHPTAIVPPAAPATQPSTTVAGGVRSHKVASGETLSIISKAVYGSSKYWDKILAANPNINPKNLKIGTTLVIPDLKAVTAVSSATMGSDHGADLPGPSEASAGTTTTVDPTTTYVVVSGDSLEKISIKLYGKPQMKDSLYETNKGVIGDDEDVLKVGMLLKLPSAPTVGATASR